MPFIQLGQTICGEEMPSFLGIFDFSTAPPFLFYSYIPIIIAALIMAVYVFLSNRKSLQAKLLLAVTLSFVFWVGNILVQWVASYHTILLFSWQLTAIFEAGIFLSTFYFAYVFFYKKDMPFMWKLTLGAVALSVTAMTPTALNITAYDVYNCEGINGVLWQLLYAFEPGAIVLMVVMGIEAYRKAAETYFRRQIAILSAGIALFLGAFFLSNFYGEVTRVYEFNLWGPLGMLCFLILLTYMIVQYHTFNIKLIATQALVAGIAVLIGARLFYSTTTAGTILSAVTLIAFLISGIFLIRSVKREIEQRERIEKLAGELQETNDRQEGLIHFIGHEVKGFLTKAEGAFASLADGDFGVLPEGLKPFVENSLSETRHGVESVSSILKASNLKKGTVTFVKEPFDFKALAIEVVEKSRSSAEKKGLTLSFMADDEHFSFTGDRGEIGDHVLRNLIDNSINYTPSGSVSVSLKKEEGKIIFAVQDTGIGIDAEDMKRLFTEGGHGKDSQKVNVHSTGYGLFIAKQITEAHGGTVHAESEGQGKGSTFIVELPV